MQATNSGKVWTRKEMETLCGLADRNSMADIAERLGRSEASCKTMLARIRLNKDFWQLKRSYIAAEKAEAEYKRYFMLLLEQSKNLLPDHTFRTIRGQARKGDIDGAYRGYHKALDRIQRAQIREMAYE